ncbi:MAG: YadA-like family protein [Variovorax sp.]|nr:YadA-like family protein [Variovorax sp.]
MNKSFKSVWCEKTGTYIAAAETSRSRGKKSSSAVVLTAIMTLAVAAGYSGAAGAGVANAHPTYGNFVIDNNSSTSVAAKTTGAGSIAIGVDTVAGGENGGDYSAIAIGVSAKTSGKGTMALGESSSATGDHAMAIGNSSKVTSDFGLALGASSIVSGANSVALGSGSVADRANTVSVGTAASQRQIVNMAAGTLSVDSTDAVNGSQLFATDQNVQANTANIATNASDIAANKTSIATNTTNIAIVDGRVTNVANSVTNLAQQLDEGDIGMVRQDATTRNITVAKDADGMMVDFTGTNGARVLSGVGAGRLAADSLEAVNGSQLFATNQNVQANTANIATNTTNIANIEGRVSNVEDSVTNLTTQLDDASIGLVQQDATTKNITVAKDKGGMSVDFTGTDGARVLSGVASGRLAVDSQEAVNGSQLFATNQNVQANTNSIAINTANIAANTTNIATIDGRFSSVEDSVSSLTKEMHESHATVIEKIVSSEKAGSAHVATAGDSSQKASATGENAVAVGAGASASANNSVALGAGSSTGNRENVVSVGSAGNERAIANVADGVVDTDAVNKRQLDAVSASNQAYTDQRIDQVQSDIASVRRDANGAAAAAMAVATLPQAVIPGRGMASASVSNMDGESAIAVGVSKVSENSRWVTKLAGTVNTRGKVGVSAGIGFHW